MPGTLHPWSPERLPVLGKHEKGEPINQKLFEEWGRAGVELGSGLSVQEETTATCWLCANHLVYGTSLNSRS